MINVLKRGTAVFLLALFVAEAPLLASEIYAESNIIPANDSYEIDYDPDDPALNDDAYDIANKISSSTMKLSATTTDEGNADDPQNPVYDWFGVQGNNKGTISFLKDKKGKLYEYRSLSKQKVYGYDTFQGACAHGMYSWHILFNRRNNKCRVIKVSMKTHKVVKVSKVLKLDHGNDMTYDEKRNWLLVIHYEPHPKRVTVIDPITLKVLKVKNMKTPSAKLPGASEKFCKSIKGVTGIGYDAENDEYIMAIMGTRHYLAVEAKTFKIVRIIKVPEMAPYVRQGMTVKDGFIIRTFSAYNKKYNQNIIYIYDMAGNFVKTCKLGTGYEIESPFFNGDEMYAGTYRSYLKKKTKKVKVKGKKKKVKKKYYALERDDNIIRITKY